MAETYANIHHFNALTFFDGDNEPLFGYYFELCKGDGSSITGLIGPYNSKAEVEAAAQKEWDQWQTASNC